MRASTPRSANQRQSRAGPFLPLPTGGKALQVTWHRWLADPTTPLPPLLKYFFFTDLHDSREWPISRWKRRISPKGDKFAPLITHTISTVYSTRYAFFCTRHQNVHCTTRAHVSHNAMSGRDCRWGEWITSSTLSTFNTTTEVRPLSKAPKPQLLPGRRSIGCPLLQVYVHYCVCVHLDGLNAEPNMGHHTWPHTTSLSLYMFLWHHTAGPLWFYKKLHSVEWDVNGNADGVIHIQQISGNHFGPERCFIHKVKQCFAYRLFTHITLVEKWLTIFLTSLNACGKHK